CPEITPEEITPTAQRPAPPADAYIIPPETAVTAKQRREETVIFSGKKSVYRYESLEATGSPAFESPTTEDSVSHHITDTGISLTRGTTTDTLTSPAGAPPARLLPDDSGRLLSDTAVDVGIEETELTDAGLSPIAPDDVGIGLLPAADMLFLEEELVLAQYCDAASSPVEFRTESTSVALSPLQVETSEASVSTDRIDTKDASVSPIRDDASSEALEERRGSGDVRAMVRLLEEGEKLRALEKMQRPPTPGRVVAPAEAAAAAP
ncbi:Uncharacterized protein GBIM_22140, partial [Gryllus bimaculatus]